LQKPRRGLPTRKKGLRGNEGRGYSGEGEKSTEPAFVKDATARLDREEPDRPAVSEMPTDKNWFEVENGSDSATSECGTYSDRKGESAEKLPLSPGLKNVLDLGGIGGLWPSAKSRDRGCQRGLEQRGSVGEPQKKIRTPESPACP